jgi:hypothetical protein
LYPEAPVEFLTPLKDVTVMEKEATCLECELTKPNVKVKWLRDAKEFKPRYGCKKVVDGKRHRLIIDAAELEDGAEYTVSVNDKTSQASITVEGRGTCYLV